MSGGTVPGLRGRLLGWLPEDEEELTLGSVGKLVGTNSLLWLGVLLSSFPLYYLFVATTFSQSQFFQYPPKLTPGSSLVANYVHLFVETDFLRTLFNTFVYAGASTIGTVVLATLTGYAFSMFTFRGRKPLFSLILAMMSIPFQLIAIPLFALLVELNLVDTYLGGILPVLIFPIIILMMKQNFDQLMVEELLKSARIDGASELQILVYIVVPLMRPAIAAAAILTLIFRMGGLFWPLIVFRSREMYVVTEFLANQIQYDGFTQWTILVPAAALLTIIPILTALHFQQHFVKGLMAGSVD